MEEHVYDEIRVKELDFQGYCSPLKRSNQPPKKQEGSVLKKLTAKRCRLLWIGIVIGSVISGIIIFLVMQYGVQLSCNGSTEWTRESNSSLISESEFLCFWTLWTPWTGCNSILTSRTNKRFLIYTGYAKNCKQEEIFETRTCYDDGSSSCFWTDWTEWTGCNSLPTSGTEKRVKLYTGYAHNCQQKEIFETRTCNGNTSLCFWTEWTSWNGCNSSLISETDTRVQIYTGYAHNCQQKEAYETRVCSDGVSSCFWTDWTSWTPCILSIMIRDQTCATIGKQTRAKIFTGYSANCEQKGKFEARSCYDHPLDITFDPTTLYSTCFLSDDHTILSNRYTNRTKYIPKAASRLQNYQGAMVNTCVKNLTSIYFEIYFQYVITSETGLVLELGIGERQKIDNESYVGYRYLSGWSFVLLDCGNNQICLMAQNPLHSVYEFIQPFSKNTALTNVNGTFGILIDRKRNTFSLFYNDTILFIFNDVLSNVPLCPVFGVFSPDRVEVDVQILSVGNMTLCF